MKSTHLMAPLAAIALTGLAAAPAFAAPGSGAPAACPTSIDLSESAFCAELSGEALTDGTIGAEDFADPSKGVSLSVYGLRTYTAEEGEPEQVTYTVTAEDGTAVLTGTASASVLGIVSGVTLSAGPVDPGEYAVTVAAEGRALLTQTFTVTDEQDTTEPPEAPEGTESPEGPEAEESAEPEDDGVPTGDPADPEATAGPDAPADPDAPGLGSRADEGEDGAEGNSAEEGAAEEVADGGLEPDAEDQESPESPDGNAPGAGTGDDAEVAIPQVPSVLAPSADAEFGLATSRAAVSADELRDEGISFSLYGLTPGTLVSVSGLPGSGAPAIAYADDLGTAQLTWVQPLWAAELSPGTYGYAVTATPLGSTGAGTANSAFTVTD
ncbi:hypothetical protein [Brevibacterium sp.]|uniref:hypothetical protein n=1 Tax=Brevibacterium sp. TaxID=1701 RepID=UPI0025C4744F|nr:hypothetical protein [Brevibacterium sp.]